MTTVIEVENVSKQYRLGTLGTGTLVHDLNRWWQLTRGCEDPYTIIGQETGGYVESARGQFLWALKDVSFKVQRGDMLGIVGHNGAGKTTLLRIIARITKPTFGTVKIKGRIVTLFETGTGFHSDLTGRENIYINGVILGMSKKEIAQKLDEIVDFSGLEKFIDLPVKRYSSGMRAKLAFSVVAHLPQDIFIFDEVFGAGDIAFKDKAIKKIQAITEDSSKTAIFVSHALDNLKKICNRGIVLNGGKLVFEGQIDSAVEKYLQIQLQKSNFLIKRAS
ncbi:MAG: ABC transporter ATP-binding protein [Deltaproteobacteria bacterium]|jgi:lipopolysaccharide transport system ATP-binding protein|nr:ABC transporter ATP-binding protein [Deltaproteobacteria bacterium]